jgi:hypothetical protein
MRAFKGKSARLRTVLLIGIAALLAAAVIGATVGAKYVKEIRIPCRLIIVANLADRVAVLEHEPLRQPDGAYLLGYTEVSESEFVLMPGVDAARDPFIRIEGKSDIPAYVYIEVVSTLDKKVTFELIDEVWEKLDGVTGQNGGEIYAYCDTVASDNGQDITIPLLDGSIVTVSHTYIAADEAETELSFYPYMARADEDRTAAECFDKNMIGFGDTGKYTPAPQGEVAVRDGKAVVGDIGYTVYVRAAVIANWKTEDGSIYGINAEKGTDYTFTIGSGWFKAGDGYYYYSNPVESGGETSALITDFSAITEAPNGCSLSVNVSAEIIQESGSTDDDDTPTVTAVWGCTIGSDRVITK